jgi:membrane protease YdiL (CAAX protease family)
VSSREIIFIAIVLVAILGLLSRRAQNLLRRNLEGRNDRVWILPLALTAIFAIAATIAGAFSWQLTLMVLAYTAAPVLSIALKQQFLAILLLWLPLEFAAGARFVPRPAQGFLHSVAYGIAILLGLLLFLAYRPTPGLKYNPPKQIRDYWLPFAVFAISAPVLAVAGVAIGFIPPPHLPTATTGRMASAVGIIFAGTALPEEILFRSLIQNLLMQRFGSSARILFLASFIFGCAHLDNGPQPTPNWRYMILATIAGVAYGAVFQRASTVLSSATLHMLVDWTKHFFF